MQFSLLLPVSLLLSYSAAQATSICGAQPVLENCLASTQLVAAGCATTDYQCLCQSWQVVLRCFDQCPNDDRKSGVLSAEENYCADMSVYATTTTTPISAATTVAAKTTSAGAQTTDGSDAGAVRTSGSSSSSTPTASGAAATHSSQPGGAAELMVSTGGMMIAVAGLVGAFL